MALAALPSLYKSQPVVPLAPNADGDRSHSWDWPSVSTTIVSGLSTITTSPDVGPETLTFRYDGLSRANVRILEAFVEARSGRKEAFWAPTVQRDFGVVAAGGSVTVREAGYATAVWPLGDFAQHVAAYRFGVGWLLSSVYGFGASGTDAAGNPTLIYNVQPLGGAGSFTVLDSATGLSFMRLLYVRCADDALETRWTHPNFATLSLTVVQVPHETPAPGSS